MLSTSRRRFLGSLTYPALAAATLNPASFLRAFAAASALPPDAAPLDVARNESFWADIASAFTVDRSLVNLNNGGVSPAPSFVQSAMHRHLDFSNSHPPPIALWEILEPQKEAVRARLARQWNADPEELALTRNSSESLQICQLGFDLKPGDEVLTTTHDYPRMLTTFRQRARREGITLKTFPLPIPCEDNAHLLDLFKQNISPRTKLILCSHIVNITGQILPVRAIVAHARSLNIPVIVDGAHALAHFDFKLSDLDCDYYGVSLHKWLFAPHGSGLLYVRREKIPALWPLMAAEEKQASDIRKFEEIGTHPAANTLAIAEALTFHQSIGPANKEARLRFLRDHWATRLLAHPSGRVRLHTSLNPAFSCAIATFQVDGLDSKKLAAWLWKPPRCILTVAIQHEEFQGIRVTPSVYTSLDDLDRFCDAVDHAISHGIPDPPQA